MDMALAVVADLFGMDQAAKIAETSEHTWHKDAHRDPFAKSAGLI